MLSCVSSSAQPKIQRPTPLKACAWSSPLSLPAGLHLPRRQDRSQGPQISCRGILDREANRYIFEEVADALAADLLVEPVEKETGWGLITTESVRSSSLASVPVTSTLIVPLEEESTSWFEEHLTQWQQTHGEMPESLHDFMVGGGKVLMSLRKEAKAPEGGVPQGLPYIKLAAWLMWLVDMPSKEGLPAEDCVTPRTAWEQYASTFLPLYSQLSCLLAFEGTEAEALCDAGLQAEAVAQRRWAEAVHEEVMSEQTGCLGSLRLVRNLKECLWALTMVRSRSFLVDVPVGPGGMRKAPALVMAPLMDMADHDFIANALFAMSPDNRFQLWPRTPLAAGEEVRLSYGTSLSNDDLMVNYGFIVEGNPFDRLPELSDIEETAELEVEWLLQAMKETPEMRAAVGGIRLLWQGRDEGQGIIPGDRMLGVGEDEDELMDLLGAGEVDMIRLRSAFLSLLQSHTSAGQLPSDLEVQVVGAPSWKLPSNRQAIHSDLSSSLPSAGPGVSMDESKVHQVQLSQSIRDLVMSHAGVASSNQLLEVIREAEEDVCKETNKKLVEAHRYRAERLRLRWSTLQVLDVYMEYIKTL